MDKLDWIALDNQVEEFRQKCKGRNGQAWAYTVSHGQLLIRYYDDQTTSSVYLRCKDIASVSFRKHWNYSLPDVHFSDGEYGPEITISDGENLMINCGFAFWVQSDEFLDGDSAFF